MWVVCRKQARQAQAHLKHAHDEGEVGIIARQLASLRSMLETPQHLHGAQQKA